MLGWDELRVKHSLQGIAPPAWFISLQTEILMNDSSSGLRTVQKMFRDTPQAPEEGMFCWKGTGAASDKADLVKVLGVDKGHGTLRLERYESKEGGGIPNTRSNWGSMGGE